MPGRCTCICNCLKYKSGLTTETTLKPVMFAAMRNQVSNAKHQKNFLNIVSIVSGDYKQAEKAFKSDVPNERSLVDEKVCGHRFTFFLNI